MNVPNLSRIVETHVLVADPLEEGDPTRYLQQLKRDVVQQLRLLRDNGHVRWFSFLLHPAKLVAGCRPDDNRPVIHLRLEMAADLDPTRFSEILPPHFLRPTIVTLSDVGGPEISEIHGHEWARNWRLVGEASEFVCALLEEHEQAPSLKNTIFFLHYIANGLGMGMEFRHWRSGTTF